MGINEAISWVDNYILGLERGKPNTDLLELLQETYPNNEGFIEETTDYCLYRGFYFEQKEDVISFIERVCTKKSVVEDGVSSWSEDKWRAYDFLNGTGYEYYNGETDKGYGVILSCSDIEREQVVVSYLNKPEMSKQGQDNMKNDSEFVLLPGKYEVEISKLTANIKEILPQDMLKHIPEEAFIEE